MLKRGRREGGGMRESLLGESVCFTHLQAPQNNLKTQFLALKNLFSFFPFVLIFRFVCFLSPFFLFSSLSVSQKKKKMADEEYPNKETKELFEGVENGDEEVVKALLLGNKNKQFELDINFKFKDKKVFFSNSISLSLFSLPLVVQM